MKRKPAILLVAVLILLLLGECYLLFKEQPKAEPVYPVDGIITADPACNMRRDPNTSRESLRELRKDVKVQVVAEVEGEAVGDNTIWYEIMYGNIHGYVSSAFVRLDYQLDLPDPLPIQQPNLSEEEFRADLLAQGFPESYIIPLMELHRSYPLWKFSAVHTNYTFATAVRGQDRPGVNMVTATGPPEYKSKSDADFNYVSNTWHEYEPGWVGASRDLIAFQMDPRNFLNETQIFQFESQRFNPEMSYTHGLSQVISSSFMREGDPISYINTQGGYSTLDTNYVKLLEEAGRNSGVSPYHLLSRILQEVGLQGSNSVSGNYLDMQGYYNFYNIGAFGGNDPLYMGLVTAKNGFNGFSAQANAEFLFPWDNPASAVAGGAIFIGKDYINVDQHTLYLQKWNLISRYSTPFTHQYMGNVLAPEYEAINVFQAYQEMGALGEAKEFVIPVFLDMPDTVPSPTGGGNPNNWLSSIEVNGKKIPGFEPNKYEYKLQMSSASLGLAVNAQIWNPDSTILGTGIYALNPGANEIILQVTAPNGVSRNYRLYVEQKDETADIDPHDIPKYISDSFQVNALGYLYGADPLQGNNIISAMQGQAPLPEGYSWSLLSANGQETIDRAGSGSLLQLRRNNQIVNEFPVVVLGDANGDANIDVSDFIRLRKRILDRLQQDDTAYSLAMDINQDGSIDVMDLITLRKHILNISHIQQGLLN